MSKEIHARLDALRAQMRQKGVSAAIVPQADPHMSEYLSQHWQARRWLSGFTGSAGDLLVTLDEALLWTDSRYFLQAGQQLEGTEIKLMKDGLPETPSMLEWLTANLKSGETVGVNAMVFSTATFAQLKDTLSRYGIGLNSDFDVLDEIWTDRPALPEGKVFVHELQFAGVKASDKIAQVMANVRKQLANSVFISALDEIAWTLNIRCNDVRYNPVVTSFLYLSGEGSILFIDSAKVSPEVAEYLKGEGVKTAPYTAVKDFLRDLPADSKVLIESARNAAGIAEILGERAVKGSSAVAMLKACKNEVQLAGTRAAMLRDGVAMVKSLCEVQSKVAAGERLTEMCVAEILRHYRSQGEYYFDESFGTIAGYEGHGAIVHGCTVEDGALIGMGAIIMNGAVIGAGSMVAAGALVTQGKVFPPKSLIMGSPAKLVRELSDEESRDLCLKGSLEYLEVSAAMLEEGLMRNPGAGFRMQQPGI